MARLSIVNYAVHSTGLGSVQRLIAINRWLRWYASLNGDAVEPVFLTSSEAGTVLQSEQMAAFKIPSMRAAQTAEIERHRYLGLAKQWVWHSLGLLQPDFLIVDTWPRGAFGELLNAIDLARKRIFIYPLLACEVMEAADFQTMLPLYDLVLVPEMEGAVDLPFGKTDPSRIRWVGPMMRRERAELLERWEARERLGVTRDRFVLYVSAGINGEPDVQEQLLSICTAVMDIPDVHVVVSGGPLYQGSLLVGPRLTWLNFLPAELLLAFDAAICASDYNSFQELTFAGIPTAWIPQNDIADEQVERARYASDVGGTIVLDREDLRGSIILDALNRLRDPDFRKSAIERANQQVLANHARDAAQAILSTIWDTEHVDRAAKAINDHVLLTSTELMLMPQVAIQYARWLSGVLRPGDEATAAACLVLDALCSHALHPPLGSGIVEPLCRTLPAAPVGRRAQSIIALLDTLACFEDWGAVQVFVQSLAIETTRPLDAYETSFNALLEVAGELGMPLEDLAEALEAVRRSENLESPSAAMDELVLRFRECATPKRKLAR